MCFACLNGIDNFIAIECEQFQFDVWLFQEIANCVTENVEIRSFAGGKYYLLFVVTSF